MSSRILRKLQLQNEVLPDENTSDLDTSCPSSGGATRKQLNRFDLLNPCSESSEVTENETDTLVTNVSEETKNGQKVKRKKKKRKKKSKESKYPFSNSENEGCEIDEVEKSIQEINKNYGENSASFAQKPTKSNKEKTKPVIQDVLNIQNKFLNPSNELTKMFGSNIIQAEQRQLSILQNLHKRQNRRSKAYKLTTPKGSWGPITSGLSMTLISNENDLLKFKFDHSVSYQQVQKQFLEAVRKHRPHQFTELMYEHRFHIDTLIELSDLARISEDFSMAADLIERALFAFENAFHPLFNLSRLNRVLEYKYQENRAFYIVLFKHLIYIGNRALYRTALEICKLILSLEENDPLAIILAIDFYAIRSKEYKWLIEFYEKYESKKKLSQLPNYLYSIAIAYLNLGDSEKSNELLQTALIHFPSVLLKLLDKCSVQFDSRVKSQEYFTNPEESKALELIVKLYVERSCHLWKSTDILRWLESNVNTILDKIEKNQLIDEMDKFKNKRKTTFVQVPVSIQRHVVLSDFNDLPPIPVDKDIYLFDPLPPSDSINIYNDPKETQRHPSYRPSLGNTMGMFVHSLSPNFDADNYFNEFGEIQPNVNLYSLVEYLREILSINMAARNIETLTDNELNDDDDDDDSDFD